MAKRFTDTEKYKDPWFRKLPPKLKTLFYFMCDDCNHAGIWKENFDMFEMFFKIKITHEDMSGFGEKVVKIDEETYFIPSFIRFQYGELFENNNAHKGVIKTLAYNGLSWASSEGYSERPSSILARLSKKKKLEVMAKDYFTCSYCGKHGDEHSLVVDHIKPRSKGGGNNDENLTTACGSCNSKKSDMDILDFIDKNGSSLNLSSKIKLLLPLIKNQNGANSALLGAQDKDKEEDKEEDKDMDKDMDKEQEQDNKRGIQGGNKKSTKLNPDEVEVLNYLNTVSGKSYKPIEKNFKFIRSVLKNFTADEAKAVVDLKQSQWAHSEEMAKYIRPETIFGSKFESYLQETNSNTPKTIGELFRSMGFEGQEL